MNYGIGMGSATAMQAGYASDAKVAEREREIPAGVNRMENHLGYLCAQVDALDNRLTGYIARPQPSANEPKGQLRGAMGCGLGGQLDSIAERIEQTARRLSDLLDRLET